MGRILFKIIAWLLIVAIIAVTGYFGYLFYKNDFSFKKTFGIGVSEKLIEEKEIETLKEINIEFNSSDVDIKQSEDEKIKISLYSDREESHEITLNEEEGIVKIVLKEKKLGFWKRLFNHKVSRVLVYLPKDYEGSINIDGNVGDITLDSYQYGLLKTKLNVGDIYVDGIKDANIDLNVGSVKVKNAYSHFDIKVNTGNVHMKEVAVLVDSTINVDVGNVRVEETNDIKVETKVDTGKANVNINNEEAEIKLNITVRVGNINVNEEKKVEEEPKES